MAPKGCSRKLPAAESYSATRKGDTCWNLLLWRPEELVYLNHKNMYVFGQNIFNLYLTLSACVHWRIYNKKSTFVNMWSWIKGGKVFYFELSNENTTNKQVQRRRYIFECKNYFLDKSLRCWGIPAIRWLLDFGHSLYLTNGISTLCRINWQKTI